MITIQAGKMIIPEEERFVGFAGDNHSNSKQFILSEQHIYGRTYSLYLRFDDGRVTSAALSPQYVDGGTALTWDIVRENLLKPGIVMAQLKVADSDGTVTHYGSDYFIVSESAEFADDGGEIDILSRTEFEERMAQAVSDARATAPYIGDDGYWYVYSPQQGEYVRSWSANNITVDSAVSASSANPVENRAVKAYVDAADSLKVDTTRKVAGHALDHNITPSELYDSLAGQINPRLVETGTTPGYPAQYGRTMDGHKPVYCSNLNTWVELAKASDIPDVPTKTSDLTNDSGFLTSHQDISGKVDKTRTIAGVDLQDDVTAAELRTALSVPLKISDLENDTPNGYGYTKVYITMSSSMPSSVSGSYYDPGFRRYDVILNVTTGAFYQCTSFSRYEAVGETRYNYSLVPLKLKCSMLNNDIGFLTQHQDISSKENISNKVASVQNSSSTTEYPSVAAMTAYVGGQGFLTQHQDISSKENISNKVATVQNSSSTTEYPSVAAMTAYVGAQGFLTQHQDISGKSDLILTFVPADAAGTHPDLTSSEFTSLAIGQAFLSVLQGSQLLFVKVLSGNSAGAYCVAPTRTSQLSNDSGFLTSHQSLSGKMDTVVHVPNIVGGTAAADAAGSYCLPDTSDAAFTALSSGQIFESDSRYYVKTSSSAYRALRYGSFSSPETALSSNSTDRQVPSARCVYNHLADKADNTLIVKCEIDLALESLTAFYGIYSEIDDYIAHGQNVVVHADYEADDDVWDTAVLPLVRIENNYTYIFGAYEYMGSKLLYLQITVDTDNENAYLDIIV